MAITATVQAKNWGVLIHPEWQAAILSRGLSLEACFSPAIFQPSHYQREAVKVGSGGRNAAWYVPTAVGPAVLRQYRRGGLIGKFNQSKYFFTGPEQSRAFQEFSILTYLQQAGLAVPKALGACYQRQGLFCEMALITSLIADSQSLAEICQHYLQQALDEETAAAYAAATAKSIHQMHDLGVWHADLNAHNILCGSEPMQAYIIDFDKAKKITVTPRQRQQNLARLERSLIKLCGEQSIVFMEQISKYYQLIENN